MDLALSEMESVVNNRLLDHLYKQCEPPVPIPPNMPHSLRAAQGRDDRALGRSLVEAIEALEAIDVVVSVAE